MNCYYKHLAVQIEIAFLGYNYAYSPRVFASAIVNRCVV